MNPVIRIALVLIILAGSHFAVYRLGGARATHSEHSACQATKIQELTTALQQINAAATHANHASLRLGELISARQQADATATQEIRHALQTTAHLRVDCVFDDGVMRQLATARNRANTAAAAGIADSVPAAAAAGK